MLILNIRLKYLRCICVHQTMSGLRRAITVINLYAQSCHVMHTFVCNYIFVERNCHVVLKH